MTDAAEVADELRAPSNRQESKWHVPPFNYATKPRALLETAADLLLQLQGERDDLAAYRDVVNSATACDRFDAAGDLWLELHGVKRMFQAVGSVFSKWASEDIMVRFRQQLTSLAHLAFVEGCLVGSQAAEAQLSEAMGVLKTLRAQVSEMEAEYLADECCDQQKLNQHIELVCQAARVSVAESALAVRAASTGSAEVGEG